MNNLYIMGRMCMVGRGIWSVGEKAGFELVNCGRSNVHCVQPVDKLT